VALTDAELDDNPGFLLPDIHGDPNDDFNDDSPNDDDVHNFPHKRDDSVNESDEDDGFE
jgi:hypothetical protein